MREPFRDEVEAVMAEYGLPPLPDYYDGIGARDLVLFRTREPRFTLTQCTLADAQKYCSRDDTTGEGWFTGFDRTYTDEQEAAMAEDDGNDLIAGVLYDRATGYEAEDDDLVPDGYDPSTADGPDPEGITRPSYGD